MKVEGKERFFHLKEEDKSSVQIKKEVNSDVLKAKSEVCEKAVDEKIYAILMASGKRGQMTLSPPPMPIAAPRVSLKAEKSIILQINGGAILIA